MEELKRIKLEKEAEAPFYLNDPKLLEIYNKSLPPKESYYYFPKGEEIMTLNPKKPIKSIRRIFYNLKYTEYVNKLCQELKEIIKSHTELKLPDYFDDYVILMFVYARGGDLNASYELIIEYLNFINKNFPFLITPKSKEIEVLNKGFIYTYGRDNRFRPIIVCQCKVFQKYQKQYPFEDLLPAISFMCQYIINNMIIPGQFETWNMIVNFKGISIISLPDSIKKLIPALSNYFPCRMNKTYIIGLSFITRLLYRFIVNFIDPITASKIIVINNKKDPALYQSIRKDNIEEQFGGTAPNLPIDNENGYFPPRMPSNHFIKDEENKNDILITEENYIKKYKNGEIPVEVVSLYIYKEIKEKEKLEKNRIKSQEIKCDINSNSNNNIEIKKYFSAGIKRNLIQDEIIKKKQRINEIKKLEFEKMKKFVNNNWIYDDDNEELINYNMKYAKCIKNNSNNNIINDINAFRRKKQNYVKKIFSIN